MSGARVSPKDDRAKHREMQMNADGFDGRPGSEAIKPRLALVRR